MTELKKLIEAAKGMIDALGGGRDVYIGSRHIDYDATFVPDRDPVKTLRAAIPAAEAELAGLGEVVEALRIAVSSHKEKFDSAMQSYKDALREAKREAWEEGFQACVRSTSLKVDIYAEDNPYAPPSEPEEKL